MSRTRAPHLGPERRRPAVLDAALRLVIERGVRGVSMEAVAAELGVTKPVVYACFASREELLMTLLEREEARLFAGVTAAMPAKPDFRHVDTLLVEGFQALLKTVAANADAWHLVFASDPYPEIAHRYGRARRQVAKMLGVLIRQGMTHWEITDIDRKAPVLVELFMSIGDGAVRALLQQQKTGGGMSPEELGAFVGRMALGALQKA